MYNFKKIFVNIICTFMIIFSIPIAVSLFLPTLRISILKKDYKNYSTGDLYNLAKVKDYFSLIPYRENLKDEQTSDINSIYNSDIITMGDSFFNLNIHKEYFSEKLEKSLNKSVYNVPRDELSKVNDNPLLYLQNINYKKGNRKYLILGGAERFSLSRALNYENLEASSIKSLDSSIENVFNNSRLKYMSYNNILIAPIEIFKSTLQFKYLREIDPTIKEYSVDPKMLFYDEGTSFVKKKKTDNTINTAVYGIEYLAKTLKEKYNLELVYLSFPDKYSLYGNLSDKNFKYDNYLSKLSNKLSDKNIKNIDIYKLYKNKLLETPEELLYYINDTHFTETAENIVIKELSNLIAK